MTRSVKIKLLRLSACGIALASLSACATLDQYADDFEQRWAAQTAANLEQTPATLEPVIEAVRDAAPTLAVQKAKLAKLVPGSGCHAIYELAASVLNQDSKDTDARLKLAACDYDVRDLASARQRYNDVLAETADPRALKGLALTELKDGRAERALDLLKQANQKSHQSDWQIMNALGYAEDQLGHVAEAEAAFLAAASLAPERGAPMNNVGMHYLRAGRYDDAIKAFNLALNREPDLKIATLNRRIAYAVKGNYARAFANATELERSAVLNSAGAAALAKGDTDTARWLFREALDTSPVFYENAYANLERAQLSDER